MPFDGGPGRAIGPGAVAACVHGMSEDCRAAVERLRLAAELAAASVRAGGALRKTAAFPSGETPARTDKALPTHNAIVRAAESR
jgi:hypothetical protein